jgi:arginase
MNIDSKNVLRLKLPQWQGGDQPDYQMGAQVVATIAPEPQGPVEKLRNDFRSFRADRREQTTC